MDTQKIKSAIESLLFISGEPIKSQKLAKICQIPKNKVDLFVSELSTEMEKNRGLRIITKGDSYQLVTAPENDVFVKQLIKTELNSELSRAALETISIIAYRGPITRSQIESIRGVNCSYVLRNLLIRGLVERKETSDIRGYVYEISFQFLKSLGISYVNQLPEWEKLSKNEKISKLLTISESVSAD